MSVPDFQSGKYKLRTDSSDEIREKDESYHGRNVRISPSDTIIELRSKQSKQKRKSSLSGSRLFRNGGNRKNPYRKFQMKECFVYTQNQEKYGFCLCGLPQESHPKDFEINRNKTWSALCTRRLQTNTYGEINFDEVLNSSKPYLRISDDTSAKDLIKLMRNEWGIELPNLVISVTGGAKSFKLKPRLKEVFSKGLVKVANSTGAWIITGGTNAGVMKHVGEAVKNRGKAGGKAGRSKVNVIGIAPWGVLDNNRALISEDYQGLYPAVYRTNTQDPSKTGLDCNHSCFLLVDNGTTGKYATEIKLRSRVEKAIAQYKTDSMSSKGAIGIPVVILCLEGGPGTIQTMVEAIRNGTPAVVIDGSGRAADVVSFAYKHLIEDDQQVVSINDPHHASKIDPEYVGVVQNKVAEVFGKDNIKSIYSMIEELLRDEKMITVFRLDDEGGKPDMDLAILTSLLKANKASFQEQLKLALAWNRIDVAKSEIFTEDLKKKDFNMEWLYESMFAALIDDKPDFVELFFHEGINLKHFLTLEILEALYTGIPENTPIKHMASGFLHLSHKDTFPVDMCVVGHVMKVLMGDRFKSRYLIDPCYTVQTEHLKKHSVCFQQSENDGKHVELTTPYLDLFTWAVLANRRKLGQIIWEKLYDSIACALMASKLLNSLADFTANNKELTDMADDLLDHSRLYELKALGVLEECRKESDKLAQALLVKNLPNFGDGITNLDLAVSANNQDFIAHTSCQTILNRLWMGELYINTEVLKVLFCIFNPWAIPWLVTFHEDIPDIDTSTTIVNPNRVADEDIHDSNDIDKSVTGSEASLQNDFQKPMDIGLQNNNYKEENYEKDEEDPHDSVEIKMGSFQRVAIFQHAPYVKFSENVISYCFFLLLYSFLILTRLNLKVHNAEYVLQGWVFTLFCEEIRQLIIQEPTHFLGKVEFYFQDPWNIADCASLLGFIVATVLRYVAEAKNDMNILSAARIIYSADIIIFILRLLQIFSVNRHMGPKLVMIRKMLNDLVYFVVILAVFVIGYGVATQAVLYPNSDLWDAVVGVLNKPYWQMYGELFADDILETKLNCTTGEPLCGGPGEPCRDEFGKYVAPVYMALYMLFTNILLLNLLIAIFNYTFEQVQEDSDKVWKFQRYDLIQEYRNRPPLCPPFIILAHIFFSFKWILQHCGCIKPDSKKSQDMELLLHNFPPEDLIAREFVAAETHGYDSTQRESETQDERVKTILLRVNQLSEELEQIKYSGTDIQHETSIKKDIRPETKHGLRTRGGTFIASQIEPRLNKLEQNVEQILQLILHQNQRQALLLEASEDLRSSDNLKKSKIATIHMKARMSPYPGSTTARFKVADDKVRWEVEFPEYDPVNYTAPVVLSKPYWADVDLLSVSNRPSLKYNAFDEVNKVNRISHVGVYDVVDGLPRNPYGRTGIKGRGSLGRFGPNHAADPIATRWKRTSSGILLDRDKRVLEFIAIQRRDNHQWAIPGGMVEPGEHVSETLRKEFTEEALAKLEMSDEKRQLISERIAYLFRNGIEVYKGYVDDPRNTDNAWMETVACNFHDDTGEIFGEFQLQAGDDAQAVRWQRVSGNIPLFASHVSILKKVAEMHDAAFY